MVSCFSCFKIISFVMTELKFQGVLTSHYSALLERRKKDWDVFTDGDEEQWLSRDALLKISLDFLQRMKQEELEECQ